MSEKATGSTQFDFSKWLDLARSEPEQFERMRLEAIEEVINSAPTEQQSRLRAMQWRIDQECALAANPLAACMRISAMMWDRLIGKGGLCDRVRSFSKVIEGSSKTSSAILESKVMPFRR